MEFFCLTRNSETHIGRIINSQKVTATADINADAAQFLMNAKMNKMNTRGHPDLGPRSSNGSMMGKSTALGANGHGPSAKHRSAAGTAPAGLDIEAEVERRLQDIKQKEKAEEEERQKLAKEKEASEESDRQERNPKEKQSWTRRRGSGMQIHSFKNRSGWVAQLCC